LTRILIISAGYLICLFLGSSVVSLLCRSLKICPTARGGVEGAGKVIGILERFIILTLVLLNQYTSMAIVLMAKSIGRFDELKERDFAEYYLVGTLASISFALACGLIMKFLLKIVS